MNIIRVLEVASVLLLILFVVTQVIWPMYRNRPLFPIFRKRAVLERDLAQAHEARDEKELERTIRQTKPKGVQ